MPSFRLHKGIELTDFRLYAEAERYRTRGVSVASVVAAPREHALEMITVEIVVATGRGPQPPQRGPGRACFLLYTVII